MKKFYVIRHKKNPNLFWSVNGDWNTFTRARQYRPEDAKGPTICRFGEWVGMGLYHLCYAYEKTFYGQYTIAATSHEAAIEMAKEKLGDEDFLDNAEDTGNNYDGVRIVHLVVENGKKENETLVEDLMVEKHPLPELDEIIDAITSGIGHSYAIDTSDEWRNKTKNLIKRLETRYQ